MPCFRIESATAGTASASFSTARIFSWVYLVLPIASWRISRILGPGELTKSEQVEGWPMAPGERQETAPMRTSRFTEEQITLAFRQDEGGTPVTDICRKL